uniref:Uncharacterized protein n=1 Tax=Anguilla anguilla TaxID=7936 RepID=A0A0E9T5Z3_ANGAN
MHCKSLPITHAPMLKSKRFQLASHKLTCMHSIKPFLEQSGIASNLIVNTSVVGSS